MVEVVGRNECGGEEEGTGVTDPVAGGGRVVEVLDHV